MTDFSADLERFVSEATVSERLWLVRAGIPFDVAFGADADLRKALADHLKGSTHGH